MKTIITIIAFVLVSLSIKAQDIITLTNGTEIKGVVTEVGTTQIKFRKAADGPVYVMEKSDVASIAYENGTREVFNASSTPATTTTTTSTPPSNTSSGSSTIGKIGKYKEDDEFQTDVRKHYGGPRIGCTIFEDGLLSKQIGSNVISQFGWQFETRFFTLEGGGGGLFEFIPMIGGMDRGQFLPSATALIGFRTSGGHEFGVGPNLSRSGLGMVFAAGTSFSAGHVCFPVNIAFQPSIDKTVYGPTGNVQANGYPEYGQIKMKTGFRVSLLVGFNARTR